VSVQVMYASRYQGFVNDKLLAHCKPGQVWVGTSRSQIFEPTAFAGGADRRPHRGRHARWRRGRLRFARHAAARLPEPVPHAAAGRHTREARLRASWYLAHRIHETLTAPHSGLDGTPTEMMDLEGGRKAAASG
jgi:hypothetical protein